VIVARTPIDPPSDAVALSGEEHFSGLDARVRDFWRFAMSDLRMNNTRGYLAEFLVAQALGLSEVKRVEWDAYDLLFEGIRIEVKSSAYLQAWPQERLSRIGFSGLRSTATDGTRALMADVYVFCVQASTTHVGYDPLDREQWKVHVVGREALTSAGESIAYGTVRALSREPIPWEGLSTAVRRAAPRG